MNRQMNPKTDRNCDYYICHSLEALKLKFEKKSADDKKHEKLVAEFRRKIM